MPTGVKGKSLDAFKALGLNVTISISKQVGTLRNVEASKYKFTLTLKEVKCLEDLGLNDWTEVTHQPLNPPSQRLQVEF